MFFKLSKTPARDHPQISSNGPRKPSVFEVGLGTGWSPSGCPDQNANFRLKADAHGDEQRHLQRLSHFSRLN